MLVRWEEDGDGDGDAEGGLVPAGPGRTSSGGTAAYRSCWGCELFLPGTGSILSLSRIPAPSPLPILRTFLSGGSAEPPRESGKEISFISSYSPSFFPSYTVFPSLYCSA
ncbi:unnamed protein product [Coccothraustes coccothraustes]